MIQTVRGPVEERGADYVVLSVGPVSLRVLTTTQTLSDIGGQEAPVQLHTYLYMREDVLALYGFATTAERALFERLIGVTGVGPRVALNLLSGFTPERLSAAIDTDDVVALTRAPGVGRKTAQRIILELRGKLAPPPAPAGRGGVHAVDPADADLIEALTGLGFSQAQAVAALGSLGAEGELSDEEKLRAAIRYIGGR
jgi:Holliday junction DNA helicase RuvA